jgi:K+-sensing histidine kinase KdpD
MILLDNPVKYVNTKGRIALRLKRSGNTACLSVSNRGDDISEEQITKISTGSTVHTNHGRERAAVMVWSSRKHQLYC